MIWPPGIMEGELRPVVRTFATAMEHNLRLQDEKRGEAGWRNLNVSWLISRLHEEVAELENAIDEWKNEGSVARAKVKSEAADVANFAMMIADVV